MTIDERDPACVRSRVDRATAAFYYDTRRIVLVADRADVDAAQDAITELRNHLGWVSPTSLVPAGALALDTLAAAVAACHACPGPGTAQNELLDAADAVVRTVGYIPAAGVPPS